MSATLAFFRGLPDVLRGFGDSWISLSYALREELKDTRISVTCLKPGAIETEFFRRADMLDTKVGTEKKDVDVAKDG